MGKLQVIVGGFYGSEGKGAVCAWLTKREAKERRIVCCRVGGPNAGHTAFDSAGREWKLQQVPIGAIAGAHDLMIGQGSEIDSDILFQEMLSLRRAGFLAEIERGKGRLMIDPSATRLDAEHARLESEGRPHGEAGLTARIGSTGKGVGAARSERIWRRARTIGQSPTPDWPDAIRPRFGNTAREISYELRANSTVQIEGTQGYALGLHTADYPFTTSADCRAIDVLAQAGVSPWQPGVDELEIWVVFRTFPIRVAGNSGPLYRETSWEQVGQQPERTTVTKKIRRIGEWDPDLAREALYANGARSDDGEGSVQVALLFLDYVFPELAGVTNWARIADVAGTWLLNRELRMNHSIAAVGTGPTTIVPCRWDG